VVRHTPYPEPPPPSKEARDLVTNPKAAILKAREQFKVRQLREGRIADRSLETPLVVDATDDFEETSRDSASSDQLGHQPGDRQENAPFLAEGAESTPRTAAGAVPPVSRDEIRRPYVTITHFPEDDLRFESIPDDITARPENANGVGAIEIAETQQPLDDSQFEEISYWEDGDDLVFDYGATLESSSRRRESFINRFLRERRERRQRQSEINDREFIAIDPARYHLDSAQADEFFSAEDHFGIDARQSQLSRHPEPEFGVDRLRFEEPPRSSNRSSTAAAFGRNHRAPDSPFEIDIDQTLVPVQQKTPIDDPGYLPRRRQSKLDQDDAVSRIPDYNQAGAILPRRVRTELSDDLGRSEDWRSPARSTPREPHGDQYFSSRSNWMEDDLPQWDAASPHYRDMHHSELSPQRVNLVAMNTPQICRTCRDFRPADSGDRGWCNNPWAFRHRRMVDAGVLSCGSSIGNWWLAHDGVWQRAADVSRHAQETPLLDQLLGHSEFSNAPPPRKTAGKGR
jgi:hypothetical protein